jgi:hypothetical protein
MTFQELQNGVREVVAFQQKISKECKTTNPTTALSQQWVAEHYEGHCENAAGYDVVAKDGRKIQVKARWFKDNKTSGPSGGWVAGEETEADLWVFVGFGANYELLYAFEMTPQQVVAKRTPLDLRTPNKVTLSITKKLLETVVRLDK